MTPTDLANRSEQRDALSGESANLNALAGVGTWFLREIWYFAVAGSQLKPGKMVSKTMLGEPVLVGRDKEGKVFALRDICPHQGVPLSCGSFNGEQIECCFHAWSFNKDGVCTVIPSLAPGQNFNLAGVRTKSYPCQEVQGSVWVYFGEKKRACPRRPQPQA